MRQSLRRTAAARPGPTRPDLAGLLELGVGAPAFEAVALGLEALEAGVRGETKTVLDRAGRAVALLDDDHLPPLDRCTGYVACAAAYCGLSLWELVDELYDHAHARAAVGLDRRADRRRPLRLIRRRAHV